MTPSSGGPDQIDAKEEVGDGYAIMPLEEVAAYLESIGLDGYRERSEVSQRTTGTFRLAAGDGRVTVEIDRPVRIVIKAQDLVADLPAIVTALKQRGFKA